MWELELPNTHVKKLLDTLFHTSHPYTPTHHIHRYTHYIHNIYTHTCTYVHIIFCAIHTCTVHICTLNTHKHIYTTHNSDVHMMIHTQNMYTKIKLFWTILDTVYMKTLHSRNTSLVHTSRQSVLHNSLLLDNYIVSTGGTNDLQTTTISAQVHRTKLH